jgi:hypothetical protein
MERTGQHTIEEIRPLGFMSAGCLVLLSVFEPERQTNHVEFSRVEWALIQNTVRCQAQ